MLHRSFKPAKCKTALKLAASRIKLLKNQKEAQVRKLRRELSQLLEAGQDQTARIRVEHVVREEKTTAAYDLIEIYCELIAARLPIIESQKTCPIDLKEAISSVIFASPRCADIPELMDVRKHFVAKYGKEFVNASVELRPDCGVSRLLVEKLSAKAPDGPTKIKILTAIAEEHNVKWEPKSFGEKDMKPPEDLLNGPSTLEHAGNPHVEPPSVQQPPYSVDKKGPPHHPASSKHHDEHDVPLHSHVPNSRSSFRAEDSAPADTGFSKLMTPNTSHSDLMPSRNGTKGMEHRHPYSGEGGHYSFGRPSWNMEFKDATAAAQAAAESAERASMAARAAAELSSQGMSRQHSADSHKNSFGSRGEDPQNHADSNFQGRHFGNDPVRKVPYKENSRMPREQSDGYEKDDLAGLAERFYNLKSSYEPSQSTSPKSRHTSNDDFHAVDELHMKDKNPQKTSSGLGKSGSLGGTSVKGVSSGSDEDYASKDVGGVKSNDFGYFDKGSMHSHSRTPSDGVNIFSDFNPGRSSENVDEGPSTDEERFKRNATETSSLKNVAVFDDSGSDDDEIKFHAEEELSDRASYSDFLIKGSNLTANAYSLSRGQTKKEIVGRAGSEKLFASEQHSTSVFSEDLSSDAGPSQRELSPVAFDDSDGPSSEGEEESVNSKLAGSANTDFFSCKESEYSINPELTQDQSPHLAGSSDGEKPSVGFGNKQRSGLSSSDCDCVEVQSERNQPIEVASRNDGKFGYANLSNSKPSAPLNSNEIDGNLQASGLSSVEDYGQQHKSTVSAKTVEPIEESRLDSGKELNFEILTGGLRNKGFRRPPYRRNPLDSSSLSKKETDRTSSGIEKSSFRGNFSSRDHDQEPDNQIMHQKLNEKMSTRNPVFSSDSDDDNSSEELSQHNLGSSLEPYSGKSVAQGNKKVISRAYFDSDNSDHEDNLAKDTSASKTHTSASKTRSGAGFSRRTKAYPSKSDRDSHSKPAALSESSVVEDFTTERKSSFGSYATKTHSQPQLQNRILNHTGSTEQRSSEEAAASKPITQSTSPWREESSSKSSAMDNEQGPPSHVKISDYQASSRQPRIAGQATSKPIPEFKRSGREEGPKSSASKQTFTPPSQPVAPDSAETSKHASSYGETPSRENSIGKASHVHPKLPDYDSFTAHLLSLRQNRR
ncbi:hypothetical protein Tsubulata_008808 [Turnera subulata]|uniref:IST1-like protein n=1 Tax=Turnera subulata TaxID=218843 RepID=A0A9Q0JKR9_9ROSI|nr:hypothetical protein Tsubulata_008808 [Turnera subulata]